MSFEKLTSDHEPPSAEVFLDTSIFCCMKKGPLFRARIREVLSLFKWKGTSSYAKVEYGNVVLAPAEYYLRKLTSLGSLAALLDFIGNVLPHHRNFFNLISLFGESPLSSFHFLGKFKYSCTSLPEKTYWAKIILKFFYCSTAKLSP